MDTCLREKLPKGHANTDPGGQRSDHYYLQYYAAIARLLKRGGVVSYGLVTGDRNMGRSSCHRRKYVLSMTCCQLSEQLHYLNSLPQWKQ